MTSEALESGSFPNDVGQHDSGTRSGREWPWALLPVLVATVAMHGAFSATRVFFVRDLAFQFWPMHLWVRDTVLGGEFPLWDPDVGYGQSAIADPVRHLLFPPVLLLRLLAPEVIGFNLTVALPFALAALGTYLFLRRIVSCQAAAFGAIAFSVSGPVLSTGNFLNTSWSVALLPWALYAAHRLRATPSARGVVLLAVVFALLALAGEPVTLLSTATLVVVYSLAGDWARESLQERFVRTAPVVAAGLCGALLAAVQFVPLSSAVSRSFRGGGAIKEITSLWSIHPLTLVETVAAGFFGDYLWSGPEGNPWLLALNDGLGPYLYSVYLGVGVLAFAALGVASVRARRTSIFWLAVALVFFVLALGHNTPIYPFLQTHVPFVASLRSPAKYLIVSTMAMSVLAALGWESYADPTLRRSGLRRVLIPAVVVSIPAVAALLLLAIASFDSGIEAAAASLGSAVGVEDPAAAGRFVVNSVPLMALRLLVLTGATVGFILLGASSRPEAGRVRAVMFAMVALDLVVVNAPVNPTIDVALLREPAWVARTREHPENRIYVAGRLGQVARGRSDPDLVLERYSAASDLSLAARDASRTVQFATFPQAWGLHDTISFDNNAIWPREYYAMLRIFADQADDRVRYLSRTGVRYFVMTRPPRPSATQLATIPDSAPLALYDGGAPAPRVSVVPEAIVEPSATIQTERMFSAELDPARQVLVSHPPDDPSGVPGASLAASAEIIEERGSNVSIQATAPDGGAYLVLLDSYHPDWVATVDGERAAIVRANGLFRAVRLAPGQHLVEFAYRPVSFYAGAIVSVLTALLLTGVWVWGGKAVPRGE